MKRAIAACALLCLMFTGCALSPANPGAPDSASSLPMPEANERVGRIMAPLYFLSSDYKRLEVEMREIDLFPGQSRAEIAIREMLKGPQTTGLKPVFWEGTELRRVEIARRVANVYFNETVEQMYDQDRIILRAAIANMLAELERVDYVNIYSENREPGYKGRPSGPISRLPGDLELYLTQMKQELDPEPLEDTNTLERRNITLYFLDPTGRYLLPEVREIQYTGDQMVSLIVDELVKGPRDGLGLRGVIPAGFALLRPPKVDVMADGRSTVVLSFSNAEGADLRMAYAALTATITGFLPKVQYMTFMVDEQAIEAIEDVGVFENGLVPREAFEQYIGAEITLYFPNEARTALVPLRRAITQPQLDDARMRLVELEAGPGEEAGIVAAFPSGTDSNDILDVRVQGDVVWINLSAHLFEQCQRMSTSEESMFIFSMVNTVCEIEGVTRVQFLRDGEPQAHLTTNLDLRNPLLKNPGLCINP